MQTARPCGGQGQNHGSGHLPAAKALSATEKKAWDLHHKAFELYYKKDFKQALQLFGQVQQLLRKDSVSDMLVERCRRYVANAPGEGWDGVEIMTEK